MTSIRLAIHTAVAACLAVACLAVACLVVASPVAGQSDGAVEANPDLFHHIDETLESELDELIEIGRGGEDDVNREIRTDSNWGGNAVTSNDNPLMTEECHKDAMRHAIKTMMEKKELDTEGAVEMAKMHMHEQQVEYADGIPYSEYIAHIAECKGFCGPMVKKLITCHIASVTRLDHDMVFFDLDSHTVSDPRSETAIGAIARHLNEMPQKNVLLIGRASRYGGTLGYNRRLSGRRAESVGEMLHGLGVDRSHVRSLAFGYEPPQIDATIAEAYGVHDVYVREGVHQVNQSVMMVVY